MTYASEQDVLNAQYNSALEMQAAYRQMARPTVLLRPLIYPDGTMWCALYGDDIQSGVCGFGDTPELAARAFDEAWKNERTPDARRKEKEDNSQFGVGA